MPLELIPDILLIKDYAEVVFFHFIKIREKEDDSPIEATIRRFQEFVYKRISPDLFESENVVREAILHSGGSFRELLRLLQNTAYEADINDRQITADALRRAIELLASDARILTEKELEILKKLKENNEKRLVTPYMDGMFRLLEQVVIMEYNDGNYKRVNPIIEKSEIYKQYVG
ncbi:MAG: hypothetical protein SH848_06895 [Saprospiraceae bacterium]|nr:hypothetical protein [Saprospiraceae bacterium]MDZ4703637.1 hypothetical protein [Saprospiraceae bacterium]